MTTGRPNRARPSAATLDQIDDGGYQPRDTIRLIEDASERAAQHQGGQAVNRCPDRPFRRLHQRRSGRRCGGVTQPLVRSAGTGILRVADRRFQADRLLGDR